MRLSIIGAGYVGLVTGVCLAARGHTVVCADLDAAKVRRINGGVPPIHEQGLEALLRATIGRGLRATTDLAAAVRETDLSLIAVGTPCAGGEIDLGQIRGAAGAIGRVLADKAGFHAVVVKSTVVPGTTEDVVIPEIERASGRRAGCDFGVGVNPEFLREGQAVSDFMQADRIVLGALDRRTLAMLEALYAVFPDVVLIRTNPRTAEMIKYASNSLLATLISFSNEIGNLCGATPGVDVEDVMRGVHLDRRLSPQLPDGSRVHPMLLSYLRAGCGFGGSCFPKDLRALAAYGRRVGEPMKLLEQVIQVNRRQPRRLLALVARHFPDLRRVPVAVLGLAFKPGTDDMRDSPAIPVVRGLLARGAAVRACDPVANDAARTLFDRRAITFHEALPDALDGARAVILLTGWSAFDRLADHIRALDPEPILFDGRRLVDKHTVSRYEGIGLGVIPQGAGEGGT